jgi:hypothetical protein
MYSHQDPLSTICSVTSPGDKLKVAIVESGTISFLSMDFLAAGVVTNP